MRVRLPMPPNAHALTQKSRPRQWNIVSPADFLELIGGHLEQLRPRLPMRMPGHLQMWLEAQESPIPMPPRIHQDRLDLPVALAGRNDASIGQLRILYMNMHGVGLEPLPVGEWALTHLHKIGKIK